MYKRGFVIFGVVSLTMGNSGLPARHRLPRDVQLLGKGLLRHAALLSDLLQLFAKGHFPVPPFLSVWLSYRPRRVFSTNLRLRFAFLPVRRATLTLHCPPEGRLGLFLWGLSIVYHRARGITMLFLRADDCVFALRPLYWKKRKRKAMETPCCNLPFPACWGSRAWWAMK